MVSVLSGGVMWSWTLGLIAHTVGWSRRRSSRRRHRGWYAADSRRGARSRSWRATRRQLGKGKRRLNVTLQELLDFIQFGVVEGELQLLEARQNFIGSWDGGPYSSAMSLLYLLLLFPADYSFELASCVTPSCPASPLHILFYFCSFLYFSNSLWKNWSVSSFLHSFHW